MLGLKSRIAIRDVQIKFGMPADGWPTAELLARLRGGTVGSTVERGAPAPAPAAPAAPRRPPAPTPLFPFGQR